MDAREGRYGCTRGPIMDFESRAISARVTKQIVPILVKHVIIIFTSRNRQTSHLPITAKPLTKLSTYHAELSAK